MTTFVAVPLIALACTTVIWLGSIAWAAWHESHTPGTEPSPICPQDGLPCNTAYPCVACGWTPPTQEER